MLCLASKGNDLHTESLEGGQKIEQFFGFAGVAERQNEVAVVDDSQIAVKRVHAIEYDTGRSGGGERRGDFLADISGFATANDNDFPALPQRCDEQCNCLIKPAD